MFQDVAVSKDLNEQFKHHLVNSNSGVNDSTLNSCHIYLMFYSLVLYLTCNKSTCRDKLIVYKKHCKKTQYSVNSKKHESSYGTETNIVRVDRDVPWVGGHEC